MLLVAVVAALAVIGYLVITTPAGEVVTAEDEPPSPAPVSGRPSSVGVVVTAVLQEKDSAIVAFAPTDREGRELWELPARDWGAMTFIAPPAAALTALGTWQRTAEPLLLESFPEQQVLRLSDLGRHREPLVLSAAV